MRTLEALLQAYFSCRKHKRLKSSALHYEMRFEQSLLALMHRLNNKTYLPHRSFCFVITKPKLREIFAADFEDRIVHHLLIDTIEPYFESRFIYDSFACRKNKGTHKAVARLRKFMRSMSKNQTCNAHFLQLDIQNFFTSIDKDILYSLLKKQISHEDTLWLIRTIVYCDPTQQCHIKGNKKLLSRIPHHKSLFYAPKNKGLPIGNLTSQFFANVYLNELDQFVKRELRVKYYLRYVDDIVLLSSNPVQLQNWRIEINSFLQQKLLLTLNPKKDKSGSIYKGIDFLGYIIKPHYTLCRKRVVSNLKIKLHTFNQKSMFVAANQKQLALQFGTQLTSIEISAMRAVINSYYGHFLHANSYRLRKHLYDHNFGVLKQYLKPTRNYTYFIYEKR